MKNEKSNMSWDHQKQLSGNFIYLLFQDVPTLEPK